jgi:hypothetical protein
VKTETQVSPRVINSIITSKRGTDLFKKHVDPDRQLRGTANWAAAFFTETVVSSLIAAVKGGLAVRKDKVDSMRRRLRTRPHNVSAEQVARSMLKNQLMNRY